MKLQPAAVMISLAVSGGFLFGFCPATAKEEALRVDYNFHDWGNLDVLILKDRVRIDDRLRSWVIVVGRPDWKITCFSPTRKTIASMPYSGFKMALGERLGVMTAGDVNPQHWKKVGPATVHGIKATQYNQIIDPGEIRPPTAQMYVAADLGVNPKISRFICKFYDIPYLDGLPVRCTKRKVAKLKLDTRSIKAVPFKESDFLIPKGFKNKTLEEVLFTQTAFDY